MAPLIEYRHSARTRRLYAGILDVFDLAPYVPAGIAYALVTARAGAKPFAYPSLAALARRIHADRAGDSLQLAPVRVRFQDGPRDAVQLKALDQTGGRERLIGYAWISGRDWTVLHAALDQAEAALGAWRGAA